MPTRGVTVFLSPLVGLDIFLVELARTEVSSEETVPSTTKDQPSESRAMRDPLVKKNVCVGVHRVTDLEHFPVSVISKDEASLDCYLSGRCESGKQRPFGLQLCASHGRTFAWHFRQLWTD